jgi:hypothetical protein
VKPITELLHRGDGVLADLAEQSERRDAMNVLLDGFLDRPFRSHVQVACLREGTLVLCVDSPTWGHRIRYLAPGIVDYFRKKGFTGVREVTLSVRHADSWPTPPETKPSPHLPRSAAACLDAAAEQLGEGELSTRLRALARRARGEEPPA